MRFLVLCLYLSTIAAEAGYNRIILPEACHPAVKSAAQIIAGSLSIPAGSIQTGSVDRAPAAGEILLTTNPPSGLSGLPDHQLKHDGYTAAFLNGGVLIRGVRPRSLLFSAGDVHLWKDRTNGVLVRDPSFAIRTAAYHGDGLSMAEYVATFGINLLIGSRQGTVTFEKTMPGIFNSLSPQEQQRLLSQSRSSGEESARFARACADADISFCPFIYGNNFRLWSPVLYRAVTNCHPTSVGIAATSSWEKASLCPSDPATWQVIEAYVREFAERAGGDGIYTTFWDNYGIDCQCERCRTSGMNQFSNQLHACVTHYRNALAPLGKKLVVRTWSSGVPHWFDGQWVHAPGYDNFGGSGIDLWGRVIREVPSDVIIQTKVYHADCQPDARFSSLLGQARPHPEIAEYQITGQTTGRFYFPASTVDHTAWTMRKSHELLGSEGGVSIFPGGTEQPDYDLLTDDLNSINIAAWRDLSWQVDADVDQIWMDWAVPIFGKKAAPHIIKALRLSERVVNRLFSVLGLGSDTNSGFAGSIKRRETLLKYTNRHFLPEGIRNLEPTKENIQRVIDEKLDCLKLIDEMFKELELAKPDLTREQAAELTTRFDWLREFAIVDRHLDESLWRYRYLRHQAAMLTTDPAQMQFLAASHDAVKDHQSKLFRYDPAQKFSCYRVPLGELRRKPSLGKPMTLMQEIFNESRLFIEESVGPDYVPVEWQR